VRLGEAVGVGRGVKALGLVYFGEMWRGSQGEVGTGIEGSGLVVMVRQPWRDRESNGPLMRDEERTGASWQVCYSGVRSDTARRVG